MGQGITYHSDMQASGRWTELSFFQQMGNIGSEVSRACRWKEKGKPEMMLRAFERGLELLDMTIAVSHGPRRRELLRGREVLCDFFAGENVYGSTAARLQRYYDAFALAR